MSEKRNHVMEIEIKNKLYSIVKRCIVGKTRVALTYIYSWCLAISTFWGSAVSQYFLFLILLLTCSVRTAFRIMHMFVPLSGFFAYSFLICLYLIYGRVISNFAFSFSIISVLTGVTTLYNTGLNYGGPVSLVYGWFVASGFTMLVALSMAEICSSYPTSGGLYYWSAKLAGPRWAPFASWITGWYQFPFQNYAYLS